MKKSSFSFLALFLCGFVSPVMAQYNTGGPIQPFSAAGNFTFLTATGNSSTCQLVANATYSLVIRACINAFTDCTDDNNYIQSNANQGQTGIVLSAPSSYHLDSSAVQTLANRYLNKARVYPNRIQISQIYCNDLSAQATVSDDGMYLATCSASGCTSTSGPITVTFP